MEKREENASSICTNVLLQMLCILLWLEIQHNSITLYRLETSVKSYILNHFFAAIHCIEPISWNRGFSIYKKKKKKIVKKKHSKTKAVFCMKYLNLNDQQKSLVHGAFEAEKGVF